MALSTGAAAIALPAERSDEFHRFERLIFLLGASAVGAAIGFFAAMAFGRLDLWMIVAAAAPFAVLALHLTSEMLREGLSRKAYGCSAAAMLHVGALITWPAVAMFAPLSPLNFWIAPAVAMTALVMLASCWQGPAGGVFRLSALGLIVAALAANQGTMIILS